MVKVLAEKKVLVLGSDMSILCLQIRMKIKIFNSMAKTTGPKLL